MDQNKVGQYIALCRKEKQMTQGDLAKALNVSVQAVSKWERGNNYPDISLFPKLAEVLGTNVGELLKGEKSTMEIKTEETVSELIDYTKDLDRKKARRRRIIRLIITSTIFTSLFTWSTLTADLKQNPYDLIEVNPETSQLYEGVDQSFPFFFEVYNTCTSELTKRTLFESKIRTFFGAQEESTSLVIKYGTTDTSKEDETDATLWCPLTLEFIPELTVSKDEYPVARKTYYKNELMVEISRMTEASSFVDVVYGIYDMTSAADTTQMIMITQFSMVMDDYLIKGELPAYLVKSPQLSNYTQKVIPQDYLDMVKTNTQALAKALLKARSLSNQLDINSTNFYQGYKEIVSNYPFAERRESVYEDNQWRIKQKMVSKDTVVTFTTDLKGTPISIDIDRGDQSTSIGGIAGTLQTVAMNKLSYWPFPEGYLRQIFDNLTENKGPWIIDMKEADMSLICTDYLRHYQIKWPQ